MSVLAEVAGETHVTSCVWFCWAAVISAFCRLHFYSSQPSGACRPRLLFCSVQTVTEGNMCSHRNVTFVLVLLFPSFKMWTYLLALLYGKKPLTISWVRNLKRHRPLKHFLGVWAKTNNNFVITYMTDSADTQIANCLAACTHKCFVHFWFPLHLVLRSCKHFCSFKNKTQNLFADHMNFFKSTHTHIHTHTYI